MKIKLTEPPRRFQTGYGPFVTLSDCGHVALEPDEQVTLTTPAGGELDVVRKSWGFYAMPSLNGRLPRFGLRAALAKNRFDRYFVLLVEAGREAEFFHYLEAEQMPMLGWLDNQSTLAAIESVLTPVTPGPEAESNLHDD